MCDVGESINISLKVIRKYKEEGGLDHCIAFRYQQMAGWCSEAGDLDNFRKYIALAMKYYGKSPNWLREAVQIAEALGDNHRELIYKTLLVAVTSKQYPSHVVDLVMEVERLNDELCEE